MASQMHLLGSMMSVLSKQRPDVYLFVYSARTCMFSLIVCLCALCVLLVSRCFQSQDMHFRLTGNSV